MALARAREAGKRRTIVAVAVARELAGHCSGARHHVDRAHQLGEESAEAQRHASDPRFSYEPPTGEARL